MTTPVRIVGDPQNYADCPFTKYATRVSPIDEAQVIPLLHQHMTNTMKHGVCRRILARPDVQKAVIDGAHRRFMKRDHPGADCFQTQMRFLMQDHLTYQLRDDLFAVEEPEHWLERWAERTLDVIFPKRVQKREQAAADFRVETMVAKFAVAKMSVLGAMLQAVANETSEKKRNVA